MAKQKRLGVNALLSCLCDWCFVRGNPLYPWSKPMFCPSEKGGAQHSVMEFFQKGNVPVMKRARVAGCFFGVLASVHASALWRLR